MVLIIISVICGWFGLDFVFMSEEIYKKKYANYNRQGLKVVGIALLLVTLLFI